uniref:Uncharacterized protein n=1 Tax=Eucampia antarctica TaxID=49252 RepID=A0A7S2W1W3_9STRA|mmetsp:Transcript_1804/g.1707  ORF Transcript_1804/g.1707 Transcript_1804/m.1707 type:complete len:490 (+) Transcript_1804:157-1626(+)|eukprot:CAMPEP_0197826646 /NCGR_PEP_ID=MMETSP1437-20131217/3580_1 /TAXON_ID=49252 ORGANISM="Eucampia antarctica, Strain CCMP1452" /NCGR_SAMPLE_ID=MMETSP1437 /ASSEMBLY_ACC=CAM_ASM_001096 /LENGTH=489 /DNA_ID=CAMNT_0043427171 /DNA_START=132 /DNA_END=1601 /DNA_ORIENTATION=-
MMMTRRVGDWALLACCCCGLFSWILEGVESFGMVSNTIRVNSSRKVTRASSRSARGRTSSSTHPSSSLLVLGAAAEGDDATPKKKGKKKKSATASATAAKKKKKTSKKKSTTRKKKSVQPVEEITQPKVAIVMEEKEVVAVSAEVQMSQTILSEIKLGERQMPDWYFEDYEEEILDDREEDNDPSAIDPETLGKWDESDLVDKLEYEFDPAVENPNDLTNNRFEHVTHVPIDDDGVEVGYDPIFGRSNPIDERTVVNPQDSYMIDDQTRNDAMVEPTFPEGDLEIEYNADITSFRKSLKIVETYVDPYLNMELPRHVSKWYGEPEAMSFPDKPPEENFFTPADKATNFDAMTPHRARKTAIQLARAKNNEWMPAGTSVAFHNSKTDVFSKLKLNVGSFKKGDIDPTIQTNIEPALSILGNVVELLEIIDGTIFRFHYHGLIKHKAGMEAWTETLIRDDCGIECTNVIFETGWRKRDPYYDGGDPWFGPY